MKTLLNPHKDELDRKPSVPLMSVMNKKPDQSNQFAALPARVDMIVPLVFPLETVPTVIQRTTPRNTQDFQIAPSITPSSASVMELEVCC